MVDVVVIVNDYHYLMGGGGGPFIKELHNSHEGRACNDYNGSTICIYISMNRKLQPDSNVLRIYILHIMKGSHTSMARSHGRYGQVQVGSIPYSVCEPPDVG